VTLLQNLDLRNQEERDSQNKPQSPKAPIKMDLKQGLDAEMTFSRGDIY
jgi:hypothetical protein